MENKEPTIISARENAAFSVESRDAVRIFFISAQRDIEEIVGASTLKEATKKAMNEFFACFLSELDNDEIVERSWVTFEKNGDIVRARSEIGIYDVFNSCLYFTQSFGEKFLSDIGIAFKPELKKELRQCQMIIICIYY